MSNFHCIPEACAEIRYRKYLSPAVRWRYPGEEWQEIEADDFTLEKDKGDRDFDGGQCADQIYQCYCVANGKKVAGEEIQGRITEFHCLRRGKQNKAQTGEIVQRYTIVLRNDRGETRVRDTLDEISDGYDFIKEVIPTRNLPECDDDESDECTFTITQQGNVVHTETRDDCPEVEQLPSRKSDRTEVIKVKKSTYLQQIEVINQGIEAYGSGGLLSDTYPLPEECLNIYKTSVAVPPTSNNFDSAAEIFSPYEFVAQICSSPGYPPPEYNVVCRCGEECPDGTCAVFCGDYVCCHNPSTGTAIQQIPIDEYAGGN